VHELEPKLIITIMHGQQHIKKKFWLHVSTSISSSSGLLFASRH